MYVAHRHACIFFNRIEYKYPKQTLDDSWEKVLLNQCTQSLSFPRSWALTRICDDCIVLVRP
jgi:hypothetical protein